MQVIDSPNNTIGGTTPAARNLIAGNVGEEVRLDGAAATGNMIRGNYIGTNASGSAVLSSSNSGVYIRKAPGNSVIGNVVSGNTGFAGIAICGDPTTCGGGPAGTQTSDATGNIVQGNFVGTDAAGAAPLGNGGYGVSIDSTPNALIGGDTPGAGNVIAFNGLTTLQPGVVVFGPGATGNRILRNSIHSNGGLGIDLAPGGVTLNDGNDGPTVPPYDQDTGVNGLQNFPVLTSAVISAGDDNGDWHSAHNSHDGGRDRPLLQRRVRSVRTWRGPDVVRVDLRADDRRCRGPAVLGQHRAGASSGRAGNGNRDNLRRHVGVLRLPDGAGARDSGIGRCSKGVTVTYTNT